MRSFLLVALPVWLFGLSILVAYDVGRQDGRQQGQLEELDAERSEWQERIDAGWRIVEPDGVEIQRWDE